MDPFVTIKGDWLWLELVREMENTDPYLNFIRMVKPPVGEKYLT